MQYLTLEQLLQIHALVLLKDGGADGVGDAGRLEAAVASQYQVVFGEELYRSAHQKSAAIIRGIINDHPFVDGNKRTGLLSGLTFLEINGYHFTARKGELEDFAVHIATKRLEVDAIATWLEHHTKPRAKAE